MSSFSVVDRADILHLLQAWVYAAWQIFAHVYGLITFETSLQLQSVRVMRPSPIS